jgi:hypothetical protein
LFTAEFSYFKKFTHGIAPFESFRLTVMNSKEGCRKACLQDVSKCYAFTIEWSSNLMGCSLHTKNDFGKGREKPCEKCATYVKHNIYERLSNQISEFGAKFYYIGTVGRQDPKKNGTIECLRKCRSLPSCAAVVVKVILESTPHMNRRVHAGCAIHSKETFKMAASSRQPCTTCDTFVKKQIERKPMSSKYPCMEVLF